MASKKYLLGLDLGTNSVGSACADQDSHLVKKGGKTLWGVRLFEEASDAKGRRLARCARRRYVRRAERIDLLQMLMAQEVAKVDPTFYKRLDNSFFHEEDKAEEAKGYKTLLFTDSDYTDKEFYHEYPSIYHLRKHLIESDEKEDIRKIYLALAHMIKYRGNFLQEGVDFSSGNVAFSKDAFDKIINEMNAAFKRLAEQDDDDDILIEASKDVYRKVKDSIVDTKGTIGTTEGLKEAFSIDDAFFNEVLKMVAGRKMNVKKFFDADEEFDPKGFTVRDADFENMLSLLQESFPDDPRTELVAIAKEFSDWIVLGRLLGNASSLSEAMVARYDKHKSDLRNLKVWVKENKPSIYKELFKTYDEKVDNYVRYVGFTDKKGKPFRCDHCTREDFYKYLKAKLGMKDANKAEDIDDDILRKFYIDMSDGSFLPRQNSSDNGVFPYQLNLMEMEEILERQSKYYPFLKFEGILDEKSGHRKWNGSITTDGGKILSILTYRIPYYVGPLMAKREDNQRSSHSWVVRKEGKIYPWNFDEIVDKDASAEEFIIRMLNRCTYLPGCKCLPANSLLFQRYNLLSVLNKTNINGKPISFDEKEDIIDNVFLKNRLVTKKKLLDYLHAKYLDAKITTSTDKELEEMHASLSSYVVFADVFECSPHDLYHYGDCQDNDGIAKKFALIENIIKDLTIFEDSKIIEKRLQKEYDIKDARIVNQIKSMRLKGWGRLSREFLELKTPIEDNDTGEIKNLSLIDVMERSNASLMELINDDSCEFKKKIAEAQSENLPSDGDDEQARIHEFVNETYASPNMKRPIIQAMAIIDDYEKIIGQPIDEYYIECTRSNKAKKQRTESRKAKVEALYKNAKEIAKEAAQALKDCDEGNFRSDRVLLYFLQEGKCAYSKEPLDFNEVLHGGVKYDIDHIIPQSILKDDSLSNKVLVKKQINNNKQDTYPLPLEIRSKAGDLWKILKDKGLMSERKYNNLIRQNPLSEEELAGFVNRQLTSTNQAVKALIDTIKAFKKTKDGKTPRIIYSKAENISDFRHDNEILKSRSANNLHHAHDAYLNIVVGRALATYYGEGDIKKLKRLQERKETFNFKKALRDYANNDEAKEEQHKKPLLDEDGNLVWDYQNTIEEIRKNIYDRHDILVTARQYIGSGLLSKVSIHKAAEDKGGNLIPLKGKDHRYSDTAKYGGYNDPAYGFYSLIEISDKKGIKTMLLPIPNMSAPQQSDSDITKYCQSLYGNRFVSIIIPCIRINALLEKGKSRLIITGKTSNNLLFKNAKEPYWSKDILRIIHKVDKYLDLLSKNRISSSKLGEAEVYEKSISVCQIEETPTKRIIVAPAKNENNKEIAIDGHELKSLYDAIHEKLAQPIYDYISGARNIKKLLDESDTEKKFESLSLPAQAFIASELLKACGTSRELSDLTMIGGKANSGSNRLAITMTPNTKIIVQSPTGFYEKVIWEN